MSYALKGVLMNDKKKITSSFFCTKIRPYDRKTMEGKFHRVVHSETHKAVDHGSYDTAVCKWCETEVVIGGNPG
jgi:hypothetical protein